jgi:hypothetical protein
VGHATLVLGCIAVFVLIIFIFSFDLPGGDDVRGGPMTKYKLITTHFQVGAPLRVMPPLLRCMPG